VLVSLALSCKADDRTVYVTQSGTKYHLATCGALSHSKIPMTLEDAIKRGYSPCGICHPPVKSGESVTGEATAPIADESENSLTQGTERTAKKVDTAVSTRNLPFEIEGTVVSVTDGDTIVVLSGGERFKIRLNGIDCPEHDQAYGQKAKEFTLAFAAQKAASVTVRDIDRYGRYVGDVAVADSSLNERLVEAGLAWQYREYSKDANLARLECEAREAKRGLWSEANPVAPWDFRKGRK
jgi:endonuclease YncB( thermonuclease family)